VNLTFGALYSSVRSVFYSYRAQEFKPYVADIGDLQFADDSRLYLQQAASFVGAHGFLGFQRDRELVVYAMTELSILDHHLIRFIHGSSMHGVLFPLEQFSDWSAIQETQLELDQYLSTHRRESLETLMKFAEETLAHPKSKKAPNLEELYEELWLAYVMDKSS
jgi:hypothetical protein